MRISTFKVEQLYGFLDLELSFNDDLTVIVGRNGAGKTSALTLVSDLLRLDSEALRRVPFKSASVCLIDDVVGDVSVSAMNTEESRSITVSVAGMTATLPLDVQPELFVRRLVAGAWSGMHLKSGASATSGFHITADTINEWMRLQRQMNELVKLTFVRLDRTIVAQDPDGTESVEQPRPRSPSQRQPKDPIDEVLNDPPPENWATVK